MGVGMSFNKIIVLFLRKIAYLHEIKQNEKYPFIENYILADKHSPITQSFIMFEGKCCLQFYMI